MQETLNPIKHPFSVSRFLYQYLLTEKEQRGFCRTLVIKKVELLREQNTSFRKKLQKKITKIMLAKISNTWMDSKLRYLITLVSTNNVNLIISQISTLLLMRFKNQFFFLLNFSGRTRSSRSAWSKWTAWPKSIFLIF